MKIRSDRQAENIIQRAIQAYIENSIVKGYSLETIRANIQHITDNYISYCSRRRQSKAD